MAPKRAGAKEEAQAKRAKTKEEPAPKSGRAAAKAEPKGRAVAKPEPEAKRAKAEAPSPKGRAAPKAKATPEPEEEIVATARATAEDLDTELNDFIQHAKDGEFDEVFKILDKYPPYVNERPEERRWCTIHQACYHGELDTLKKLVEKYNADIFLKTKDGQSATEIAQEHGHPALVKYLKEQEKKKSTPEDVPPPPARGAAGDRERVNVTRADGGEEADIALSGVKSVKLRLGADSGLLCGAALVYSGSKKEKAVCYCDRKFKTAVTHSGDSKVGKKHVHVIDIDLKKMPSSVDKVYLTLCSCGSSNLQTFKNPSVELQGDGKSMIRYDLTDAGETQSTIMAVLTKASGEWIASPVGSVSPAKFCGNYSAAENLIKETTEESDCLGATSASAIATGSSSGSESLAVGESVSVEGSGSSTYTVKNCGSGVWSCTCVSWKMQGKKPVEERVCKHIISIRGKAKVEPTKGSGTTASESEVITYSEEEIAKMDEQKAIFGSWTNDKLKNLLKANDQSQTGNKAGLVAKCAYGAVFGKLGRCPKCFGGKVKFRLLGNEGKLYSLTTLFGGGSSNNKKDDTEDKPDIERLRYYCTGYFDDDEKVDCDWQANTVEHETWSSN